MRTASRILILGTSRRLSADLLAAVFDRMLKLSPSFYLRNPTGQVMSRCINDREYVRSLGGAVFMYLAETGTLYAITVPLMLAIDWQLALLALLPYPIFLVMARRIALRIQTLSREAQQALGELSEKVDESLSGQLVIKTLNLEQADLERFRLRSEHYRRLNLSVTKWRALLIASMMVLAALSMLVVLGLGGRRVASGDLAFGDFGVMLTYLAWLAVPTRTLGFVISSLRRGTSAFERLREVLDHDVELRGGEGEAELGGLSLDVRDLSVTFPALADEPVLSGSEVHAHVGGERDVARRVLDGVSFQVPAGAPNGAGIWFQACAARGQGGANSVESQVEGRVIGQSSGMPWRNSWTVDGDASDWLPEETFGTTSQTGAWAVTWDDDMLYVGVSHPDIANGGAQHWSLVYLGTGTGGTDDGVLHNTQQPSLPFVTSHLVRRKADGSYDSLEHHDGQAWNSTSPWLGTAGSQVAEQGDVLEMAIPLDAIDSPEVIELFAALIFEGGGYESTYAGVPSNSFVDGYDPDPIDVFTFDLQSSDPPTAQ